MTRSTAVPVLMLAWSAAAEARCAPARDSEVVARGGAVVTGRIVETGAASDGAHAASARIEVTRTHAGRAPATVRLLAAEAGLYTPRFRVGEVVTFVVGTPFGVSAVTLCDARDPARSGTDLRRAAPA